MQKKLSIILLVIVFAAILVFIENKGFLANGIEATNKVTTPISIFFSGISNKTSGTVSGFFALSKLQKENAELKDSVNKLQAEVAQLLEAKKENEKLRADLKFVTGGDFSYESAQVVSYDPSNIRGMITINKGKRSGLANGMAVISEGFLVGRISNTTEETANVQLITDPSSGIPVTLQQSNTNGIAKGQIGYGISMEKIPQGESIKEGDTVITSGLGGEIPRGLILGVVTRVTKQENSLFATADIKPKAQLSNLSRIIVIKK